MRTNIYIEDEKIETLKYFAIILMFFDHFDSIFFEQYTILKVIGRVVFPLFVFILVYNYIFNSKNKKNYLIRILIFALISEPFHYYSFWDYYSDYYKVNIFFTLFVSMLFLYMYENLQGIIKVILLILYSVIVLILSNYLSYGINGVLFVLATYAFVKKTNVLTFVFLILSIYFINLVDDLLFRYFAFISLLLVYIVVKFNTIKIKRVNKYCFYIFYPLHLFILKTTQLLI